MERSGGTDQSDRLHRLIDAVAALGSDLDLEVLLRRLTQTAVDLVDATYGALGVLDDARAGLEAFVTVGVDPELSARIGRLPEGHGILGLLIVDPRPIRLPDLTAHPNSSGFPPHHPEMRSFLGVPVFVGGEVYGNLYLTDKKGAAEFTEVDADLVLSLAVAAGVAIENARLHARVRELDVLRDRERIARDLHDTVIQRLFATGLALQGAARLAERPEVVQRIQQAVDELDVTVREVRSSIFELHTAEVSERGLRRQLLAIGDEMSEALGYPCSFRFEGPVDSAVPDEVAPHVVSVVREGLANIARHAASPTAEVLVRVSADQLSVTVDDRGSGPGPAREGGNGLANLVSRARDLGGDMELEARIEGGTRLLWRVPLRATGD